jgi:deoxyribonuclease-4
MELLLGAHMSVEGGLHTAPDRAASIGCAAMQVFTKNSNQWRSQPLSTEDISTYKSSLAKARIEKVVTHASYLINLCSTNKKTLNLSRIAFVDELTRCESLGIPVVIFHPGSHTGAGEEAGIRLIAESLDVVHAKTPGFKTMSTLECTAGQGSNLGYSFEQLKAILDLVRDQDRMAVCLDTCHLFAAGYPIHTEVGWKETMQKFEELIGFRRLVAIHVNDSKKELGSRVDRHEHIGKGQMGLTAFTMLMNDPRFSGIPKILETEKSEDMHEDVENMGILRSLFSTSPEGSGYSL